MSVEDKINELYEKVDSIYDEDGIPIRFKKIDYLESTGTQYIDTGIIPKYNQKYDLKISIRRYENQIIFGSRSSGNYQTSYNQIYLNANSDGGNKWMFFGNKSKLFIKC